MPRLIVLLLITVGMAGCAGRTYTIEAASAADAGARAQRYCRLQSATAELTGVQQQGGKSIEVYQCVPGAAEPATPLDATM
ncbi:MAG TPA: hypothetical protein VN668_02935 [Stellaceae bacterium]|nr:hypothetical protein [Stellaceae bacterium]